MGFPMTTGLRIAVEDTPRRFVGPDSGNPRSPLVYPIPDTRYPKPDRFLSLILPLVILACSGPSPHSASLHEDLVLKSSDGVSLGATLYPVEQPNPPGLVLVHMLGSDRRAWEPFAARAQRDGYMCIAVDLRGHGDSRNAGGRQVSYKSFTTQDWLDALKDIDAAHQALLGRGANPKNTVLVGASIGANLVLHYALDHTEVPAVVLVSPGLDYKGVKADTQIAALGQRPCLLVTSEGDSYSASSCATLKKAASGLCEIREYPGSAHGTALFDASQTAIDEVLLWLQPILKPASQMGQ